MENININTCLERTGYAKKLKECLDNSATKKGIYLYGEPGTGKTMFVKNVLESLGYDMILYNAGDVRNTAAIRNIIKNNTSTKNVFELLNRKVKNIIVVMDEIDGLNSGDKGGINTLIKMIRPKKTKKQRQEEQTDVPIICIGNYRMDKKIKELKNVCSEIELPAPSRECMHNLIQTLFKLVDTTTVQKIAEFVNADLRKLKKLYMYYEKEPQLFANKFLDTIYKTKMFNNDTKQITCCLFDTHHKMDEHITTINEKDRTSVSLLWHENMISCIDNLDKRVSIPFYIEQLNNICFSDYIDRLTFQKQIWQFNEMSSLIKTFKNNCLWHEFRNTLPKTETEKIIKLHPTEVRFTKVLTKYSTEYNNYLFILKLCCKLNMDKSDLFGLFYELRATNKLQHSLFECYEVTKLDIVRIYKYIDKYINENALGILDKEIDDTDYLVDDTASDTE